MDDFQARDVDILPDHLELSAEQVLALSHDDEVELRARGVTNAMLAQLDRIRSAFPALTTGVILDLKEHIVKFSQ